MNEHEPEHMGPGPGPGPGPGLMTETRIALDKLMYKLFFPILVFLITILAAELPSLIGKNYQKLFIKNRTMAFVILYYSLMSMIIDAYPNYNILEQITLSTVVFAVFLLSRYLRPVMILIIFCIITATHIFNSVIDDIKDNDAYYLPDAVKKVLSENYNNIHIITYASTAAIFLFGLVQTRL